MPPHDRSAMGSAEADFARRATCAATAATRFAWIEEEVHAPLAAAGYHLPLSVAVDLACLYLDGPDIAFSVPPSPPVDPGLLADYCRLLSASAARGPLRRLLVQARRSARGAFPAPAAVRTYLERMTAHLPLSPPRQARQNAPALEAFFRDLISQSGPMPDETDLRLTTAACRAPAGAEGLDLPLLQACSDHRPLQPDEPEFRRDRSLRQRISPLQVVSARSPEQGNHGITTRGNPSAVLRSLLARDCFPELLALGRLLYFDRFAPRAEPHRVLLAWVIDRGGLMRTRTAAAGWRRDAVALLLAAQTLQDAVAWFADVRAVELRIAVLLHGDGPGGPRGLLLDLPLEEPNRKPRTDGWLASENLFLPYYFLREPLWPGDPGGPRLPEALAGLPTADPPWLRALKALVRGTGPQFPGEEGDGHGEGFSLCHATVLGPPEGLPASIADRGVALRRLSVLGGEASACFVEIGKEGLHWRPWRPLRQKCEEHFDITMDGAGPRQVLWKILRERVARL